MDYIKGLGVDTVWLSSFYENFHDDGDHQNYEWDDITDHTKVGPRFGTEEDLNLKNDKVIDELKVIIFISYILTVMICVYNVIQSI